MAKKDGDEQPPIFWTYYDSSRRGSLIFQDKDGHMRMLSEVPPDTALSSVVNLALTGKYENLETSAKVDIVKSVTMLGQRTVAVNILRDALYRLSELVVARGEIKTPEVNLFTKVLEAATTIALAEQTEKETERLKALTDFLEKAQKADTNLLRLILGTNTLVARGSITTTNEPGAKKD